MTCHVDRTMSKNHYVPSSLAPGEQYESHAEKMAAMFGGSQRMRAETFAGFRNKSSPPKKQATPVAKPQLVEVETPKEPAKNEVKSPTPSHTTAPIVRHHTMTRKSSVAELDALLGQTRGRASTIAARFSVGEIKESKPTIRRRSLVSQEVERPTPKAKQEPTPQPKEENLGPRTKTLLASRSKTYGGDSAEKSEPAPQANEAPADASKMIGRSTSGTSTERLSLGSNMCVVCMKPAYAMEKVEADGLRYHNWCFRCSECNKKVKAGNYAALRGKIYCKPCFMTLFKRNGNYDNGFGEEQHKMKWIRGETAEINLSAA